MVTNIVELLIVQNTVRNGSLWSNVVFFKEEIYHSNTEAIYYASESTQISSIMMFFLSVFSCSFDDQLSKNVHRFVISCTSWDTSSENTGLWQYQRCPLALKHKSKNTVTLIKMNLQECPLIRFVQVLEEAPSNYPPTGRNGFKENIPPASTGKGTELTEFLLF